MDDFELRSSLTSSYKDDSIDSYPQKEHPSQLLDNVYTSETGKWDTRTSDWEKDPVFDFKPLTRVKIRMQAEGIAAFFSHKCNTRRHEQVCTHSGQRKRQTRKAQYLPDGGGIVMSMIVGETKQTTETQRSAIVHSSLSLPLSRVSMENDIR